MQAHITGLPQEVLATPLGQMLAPMLSPLEQQLGNIHQQPAGESGAPSQQAISTAPGSPHTAAAPFSLQVWTISSACNITICWLHALPSLLLQVLFSACQFGGLGQMYTDLVKCTVISTP